MQRARTKEDDATVGNCSMKSWQYLNPERTSFTKESFYATSSAAAADPADSCRSRNPELTATWFMTICKWRWQIEKVNFHATKLDKLFEAFAIEQQRNSNNSKEEMRNLPSFFITREQQKNKNKKRRNENLASFCIARE
jgi:hypothetical protein